MSTRLVGRGKYNNLIQKKNPWYISKATPQKPPKRIQLNVIIPLQVVGKNSDIAWNEVIIITNNMSWQQVNSVGGSYRNQKI